MPPKKSTTARAKTPRSAAEVNDDMSSLESSRAGRPVLGATEKAQATARANQVRSATQGLNLKDITSAASALSLELGEKLQEIVQKIQTEGQRLEEIREAITVETQALEEVYGKETVSRALDQMLADFSLKRAELESEIEDKEKEWKEKQIAFDKAEAERQANVLKARQQADAEYTYNQQQARKKDSDAWSQQVQDRARTEQLRQADLERGWAAREAELKKAEEELTTLRALKAGYDAAISASESKGFKVGHSTATKEKEQEIALLKKDFDASQRIAAAEKAAAEKQIGQLEKTVADLQASLAKANEENRQLAQSALSGAARQQAFADLTAIQAKNDAGNQKNGRA